MAHTPLYGLFIHISGAANAGVPKERFSKVSVLENKTKNVLEREILKSQRPRKINKKNFLERKRSKKL